MQITDNKIVNSLTPNQHIFGEAFTGLTDEKLYELCEKYGFQARLWRQKFIGLLPEVNRRRLYEKKGFSSIFEFAFKLAGLSAEQVRLALNLERRFEDKPALKKMLENGEASINKLTRIVSIATSENEEELARKIKVLPIAALNTLVRDEKYSQNKSTKMQTSEGSEPKPLLAAEDLYVQTPTTPLKFELDEDVAAELNELFAKGIDANEFLREMLKKRREEIAKKKEDIAESIQRTRSAFNDMQRMSKAEARQPMPTSRYIPVKIKQILQEEYGTKCSVPSCQKPAWVIHHTRRFGLSQNHDPRFMAPLCREHHVIAHSMDAKYHRMRREHCVQRGSGP